MGRFISADTIVPNPTNPQSYNRYSYVRNSPLNFTDPTGHRETDCESETNCSPSFQPLSPPSHPGVPTEAHRASNPPDFLHPFDGIPNPTISQGFVGGKGHKGVDFDEGEGTSVNTSTLGIVVVSSACRLDDCVGQTGSHINGDPRQTSANGGFGNMVMIEHSYGALPKEVREAYDLQKGESMYILYAHLLEASSLKAGDVVQAGDILGEIGNTGNSGGAHLHVEIRVGPSEQIFTSGNFCVVTCGSTEARIAWYGLDLVNPQEVWE